MNKQQFIDALREKLSGLPEAEVEERISFYAEMIDDRIEDGLSEEEAVGAVGSVNAIADQIIADIPLGKIVKNKVKTEAKTKKKTWEIVLLAVGAPLWFPLLIAAFAVIIAMYAVLWSLIISLWAIFVSLAASSLGVIAAGVALAFNGHALTGIAMIGLSLVAAGLAILVFFGCKSATKGAALLTKKIVVGIKNMFVRKDVA